ncbi:PIN domain-containing protein [Sphaerimonospora thailandensis]|uniref:Ribonuclease VapC n=1 Tax=Sphaerimonospora thailandensis TaxID=795644 RepID=A0A8J3VYS3_9ACTN|nr:PIN domain-containing protein [Sphaerimonospora thailandensis]GIH69767.1 ribonuclease VapC [Sphaerimonospora thailandensis]
MIVIGDTSGLIAALNRSDPEHVQAGMALDRAGLLVISPLTVTEVHQVTTIRAGRRAADLAVDMLMERCGQTRAVLAEVTPETVQRALRLRVRYQELNLDLVDVVNAVLAALYETDCLLTLDRRDFRAVRPLTRHKAFRLLPDDL